MIKCDRLELAGKIHHPLQSNEIFSEDVHSVRNRDTVRSAVAHIDELLGDVGVPAKVKLYIADMFSTEKVSYENLCGIQQRRLSCCLVHRR